MRLSEHKSRPVYESRLLSLPNCCVTVSVLV